MAAYKDLVGQKITKVTSNPGEPKTGQMWYNSTSGALRGLGVLEAFSSSAPMGTGRYNCAGWAGSAPADTSICYGGMTAAPAISNLTEEFNGSGWAAGGNTNTSRRQGAGFGIQTAAVKTGGYDGSSPSNENDSEEYNGTSWTAGNNINPQRQGHAGAGTLTAGVIFGGYDGTIINKTEEYDGTNFSNVNNMNTARTNVSGVGSQTTSLAFGGGTPSASNATETYDGTNWTTVANMNTARQGMGSFGDSSTATGTGGTTGSNSTATETWDGTSWSTSPATLATARAFYGDCGCGSSTNGIVAGGSSTATVAITEEYNKSTNTITAAAWASGGSLNTGRTLGGSAITSGTSGIVFGGSAPYTGKTESYDGSSFSETGDMNTARGYLSGFGTSTAAVAAGGYNAPNNPQSLVEEWNGSAWSEETNLPAARKSAGNCGTLTAGLVMGGATAQPYGPNIVNTTFEYDGSSWTTSGTLPEAKGQAASGGTQTAAFYAGGRTAPGRSAKTAFYNGSSWSEGADVVTISPSSGGLGATGTTSAGLGTSGDNLTNIYDGTAWATSPNYSTARNRGFGGATASDALLVGGYSPSLSPNYRADTEAFTGETTAANITDFTTS